MSKSIKYNYVESSGVRQPFSRLTLHTRRKLESLLNEGKSYKEICLELNLSRSTIWFERCRMGSPHVPYKAEVAHQDCLKRKRTNCRAIDGLPISFGMNLKAIYNSLHEVLKQPISADGRIRIKEIIITLERMGANPEKERKGVSASEKKQIIEMFLDKKKKSEIIAATGRAKSTVYSVIDKFVKSGKTLKEYFKDELRNKWSTQDN